MNGKKYYIEIVIMYLYVRRRVTKEKEQQYTNKSK